MQISDELAGAIDALKAADLRDHPGESNAAQRLKGFYDERL